MCGLFTSPQLGAGFMQEVTSVTIKIFEPAGSQTDLGDLAMFGLTVDGDRKYWGPFAWKPNVQAKTEYPFWQAPAIGFWQIYREEMFSAYDTVQKGTTVGAFWEFYRWSLTVNTPEDKYNMYSSMRR